MPTDTERLDFLLSMVNRRYENLSTVGMMLDGYANRDAIDAAIKRQLNRIADTLMEKLEDNDANG